MCLCKLSQSFQLFQLIKSSSLNISDLVLHQMAAVKNKNTLKMKTGVKQFVVITSF